MSSTKSNPIVHPPPPTPTFVKLSFPIPRVVLVTMSREKDLNCISYEASLELDAVWDWLDIEPSLVVAVLTGAGEKSFTTGADLKAWSQSYSADKSNNVIAPEKAVAESNLARRRGKKPIISAVNGLAYGAGTEFVVNSDLVVASETALFCLPEVRKGLAPFAGALPRLIRSVGLQRASELALIGQPLTAQEMYSWGLVNKVVPQDQVVPEALNYARLIAKNSPDSIICTRAGLREGWAAASVDVATKTVLENEWAQLLEGENVKEGLQAFAEKRQPRWLPPKL